MSDGEYLYVGVLRYEQVHLAGPDETSCRVRVVVSVGEGICLRYSDAVYVITIMRGMIEGGRKIISKQNEIDCYDRTALSKGGLLNTTFDPY